MEPISSHLSSLNPSQLEAVQYRGGHVLIVAGPGTGKTHTITYRIAEMLKQLDPFQRVLAITFTKKAAQEMQERLARKFKCSLENTFVGTFHSFCLFLLRKHKRSRWIL